MSHSETEPFDSYEQTMLPLDVRPIRQVSWFHVVLETKRRRFFGDKVLRNLVREVDSVLPVRVTLNADDISKLADANLRYALRFQHAADAVGWYEHSPGSKSAHYVLIDAIGNDFNSVFEGAAYTGVVDKHQDTFMENLKRFAPGYEGEYN